MTTRQPTIVLYAATHFLVDFATIFLMVFGYSHHHDWLLLVLLYNTFAFALQLPIGMLTDKTQRAPLFAAAGCLLIIAAYAFVSLPFAATLIAGTANALFHVGAGADTIKSSGDKGGPLGLFVAPGALGVFYATRLGHQLAETMSWQISSDAPMAKLLLPIAMIRHIPILSVSLLLLAVIALMISALYLRRRKHPPVRQPGHPIDAAQSEPRTTAVKLPAFIDNASTFGDLPENQPLGLSPLVGVVITNCLLAVVVMRSLIGCELRFDWKSQAGWAVALVVCTMFGKLLGGYLADRIGYVKTAVISLAGASVLFLLPQYPYAGCVSVLLFNMTMPITLRAQATLFREMEGFAFGLLSFGLYIGWLPMHLGWVVAREWSWLFTLGAVLSLGLLVVSLKVLAARSIASGSVNR